MAWPRKEKSVDSVISSTKDWVNSAFHYSGNCIPAVWGSQSNGRFPEENHQEKILPKPNIVVSQLLLELGSLCSKTLKQSPVDFKMKANQNLMQFFFACGSSYAENVRPVLASRGCDPEAGDGVTAKVACTISANLLSFFLAWPSVVVGWFRLEEGPDFSPRALFFTQEKNNKKMFPKQKARSMSNHFYFLLQHTITCT